MVDQVPPPPPPPPADLVAVDLVLSGKDLKALHSYMRRSPVVRAHRRWSAVGAVGATLPAAVLQMAGAPWNAAGLVCLAAFLMGSLGMQRVQRSAVTDAAPWRLQASAQGLTANRSTGANEWYPWGAFEDIHADRTHVFLRTGPMNAWVIPRRCFDQGEADRFLAIARHARPH